MRVKTFKYVESTVAEDGELDVEVTHRVQSGWKKWNILFGVMFDIHMNLHIKAKVYMNVVRPVLAYGAESWE